MTVEQDGSSDRMPAQFKALLFVGLALVVFIFAADFLGRPAGVESILSFVGACLLLFIVFQWFDGWQQQRLEKAIQNRIRKPFGDELPIPRTVSDINRFSVSCAIVAVCGGIPIYNLIHADMTPLVALVVSAIWLLLFGGLVAFGVVESLIWDGPIHILILFLGLFAFRRFVLIERRDGQPPVVCFGYRMLFRRLYYLKVRLDGITSICWYEGQGKTWPLSIHYDPSLITSKPTWRERWQLQRRRAANQRSLIPSKSALRERGECDSYYEAYEAGGCRERAERFGQAFIAFLQDAGALFVRGEPAAGDFFKFVREDRNVG